jgi:CO/xanthine dehydrogenase Mo-binding subunit
MAKGYRHIGKATPRKDAREIVTGKAQYIDDIRLPGMLFGKVLRSPHAHAVIKNIETARAEKLAGVKAVLTYKNVPQWNWGVPRHESTLDSKMRYVGDSVALVAAETAEIAEAALALIEVEYEVLPPVYDAQEAIKPGAPQLFTQFPNNTLPPDPVKIDPKLLQHVVMGDVEKGFAEADFVAEGSCAYENFPHPLPPEPPGVIAEWGELGELTIYVASQSAAMNKYTAQPVLGLADIRVIGTQCGGSYGTKNANLRPLTQAAALAKVTRRPVSLYYNKVEHFEAYTVRLASRIDIKVGIKKDGTVTAVSGEWIVGGGAYTESGKYQIAVGLGETMVLLRCPNWNLRSKLVCTNRIPTGVVRGFGGQELESAWLPVLSMAMEKAGLDPVEFFKKNYAKAGDGYFWRDGNWWVCRGVDYSKAMQKGAEVFGWKDKWKGWGVPTSIEGNKRRGVGVGVHGNADVGEDDSEAWVKLSPDGRAIVHACVSESGPGQRSSLCKMAAEVLSLPLERVNITPPDTHVNPFEFGLVGSRGTFTVGSAVIQAAEDALRKLLELAAPVLGAKPEDLETEDGLIYVKGSTGRKLPWRKVMGITRSITGLGRFETDFSLPSCLMQFVEVEVDVETGKTDLLRVVSATDCGQIIDPQVLNGQLHGALGAAGIDTALYEETILDKNTGRVLNGNMLDYKWRTFLDLPQTQNVILETPIPSHRFHAIGIGEIATSPGPSAVLMAISNAIGKRMLDYPVTASKILKALGKI